MQRPLRIHGLKYPSDDWQAFSEDHARWAKKRLSPDGVLHCLPPQALASALGLYNLSGEERNGETELDYLCRRYRAIGWTSGGPLRYSLLDNPEPLPADDDLERFLKLGWEQHHVDFVRRGDVPHESVLRRWRAAAGRLVSNKEFLGDRDGVRAVWSSLADPERPALPLRPPLTIPSQMKGRQQQRVSDGQAAFWESFSEFCQAWQLTCMATWDLPEPSGPQWPRFRGGRNEPGVVELQSPWHFPLQESDNVGALAVAAHADAAAQRGVKDLGRWSIYATLLPIAHWQAVFMTRYPEDQRVKPFQARVDALLGELVGMSEGRIKKLRLALESLRSGTRHSLRGVR